MGKEKMDLPFEITYSEKPSKKSKNMKRLAVLLKPENVDSIIAEVKGMGLEATVYDVKGAGKDKERVSSGRGMGTIELAYTTRKVVATVVNADDMEEIIAKMKKALGGASGAVVVVSPVDDLVRL
ncbi:MAG TPA: P-II family nitrogen regulator [Nitrososphaera sp.]|jgi:nitrogen regulatory protein PII|nr:P-II family nitrogen regulator [Nitrososphaera sp.]